ncbi:MAG: DUF1593 domain-containing protein [Marinilabiliaceae bacterium]|nr:DUF1593 domain-containing protein [Marinilabiliaceae bacterium]
MEKAIISLLTLALAGCTGSVISTNQELKPRLVVLTDIGPASVEPDDNESAVRLMSYADRFEIEAICTSTGWNCDPYPAEWADYLFKVIDAYEKDVPNLMKRSNQEGFLTYEEECGTQKMGYWPSAEYIRSRSMMGSQKAGIGVIGDGNDSPGSNFLIRLADEDDPRPIWVTAWGGANTLAQAIWRVKQERSAEELLKFVRKFRLYTITDQDMKWDMRNNRAYSSHQWLRREFQDDLLFVWDESAWLNQNELGKSHWESYASLIQTQGELGKTYPNYLWGVEGDTPSFLNIMPNGLNDPEDPTQVGWGGYHSFGISPDSITSVWTNWQEPQKSISDGYEKRFYPDEFNDFAARMAWAQNGTGNTNPVVIVNGESGIKPIHIDAEPGEVITLDASESYDAENNSLSFRWWQQNPHGTEVVINNPIHAIASFTAPEDIDSNPIHIICEVHDNGAFTLVSYRRVIID